MKTVKKVLSEQTGEIKTYEYPNDRNWVYSVQNQKWFAARKNNEPLKWINITDNPKYEVSIKRLDKQFPNARNHELVFGIPLKNAANDRSYENNQKPDFTTELPTPGYKDPNRFNANAQRPTQVPYRRSN